MPSLMPMAVASRWEYYMYDLRFAVPTLRMLSLPQAIPLDQLLH